MTKVRAILQRRWPLLVVTTVLGMLAGVASTFVGPGGDAQQYEAEQVLVATTAADAASDTGASVTQDELKVTRGEVPRVAAELLGEPERAEALARDVEVTSDLDSNSITLVATASDPERASDVVQAFSQGFLQVVNAELRSEDDRQLEELRLRAEEAATALETFDNENAAVLRPDRPVEDSPALNALLAERERLVESLNQAEDRYLDFQLQVGDREPYTTLGPENPRNASGGVLAIPNSIPVRAVVLGLLGLGFGVVLVLLLERLHRRIDTREELASMISVPILAEISRMPSSKLPKDVSGRVQLDGPWSEDYRRVRSAIQFVQAQARAAGDGGTTTEGGVTAAHAGAVISGHGAGHVPRVFLFASALPSEGKSTSTALTALALAETGENALVINADFRKPTIEKYLGVPTSPSLADLARMDPNRPTIDKVVQPAPTEHLWVAPAGPPTLDVKNRLSAATDLAREAARQGGTVLIDSSPLRVTADPMDLLPVVDEVILVVRSGSTTVKSLEETIEMLDMHHAPVMGVVLVGTPPARDAGGYYGTYIDDSVGSAGGSRAGRRGGRAASAPTGAYSPTPPVANGHGAPHAQPQPQPQYAPQPQPQYAPPPPPAPEPQQQPQYAPQPQHAPPPAPEPQYAPSPGQAPPSAPAPGSGPPPPGYYARPPQDTQRPVDERVGAGTTSERTAQPATTAPPAYDPSAAPPPGPGRSAPPPFSP